MKIFVILAVVANVSWAAIKCNSKNSEGKLVEAECTGTGVTTCTSPKFVEYSGMSDQAYGCGKCDIGSATKCAECTGTDGAAACNTLVEAPAESHTFECHDYTFHADHSDWEAEKEAGTCHALKDTKAVCNSPSEKAPKEYTSANKGCGPCLEGAKKAGLCEECMKTGCNSASTLAYALIPLLAVIFHAL